MSMWLSIAFLARLTAPGPAETFEYTIKKGDTCASISREVYGDRTHYELIHRNNRWLGAQLPHHLEPGQTLVLPKAVPTETPDAEVTAARRRVEARSPDTSDWSSASLGLDLYRGWRVNTHDRASAEITFRDDSRIEMRENTLVIIYGGTRGKSRRSTTEAVLDRGALRSRLGAYTGGKVDQEVTVTTPSAVAEFSGGVGLVTVDDDGTSRVANHGKGKASVRSSGKKKRRRSVGVKPKMGSKVGKGGAPTKPKPLPPTPAWIERGPNTFLAAGDRGGTIYAEWGATAEARSYRVEIARQPDGRELVADQTVGAQVHRFEAQQLPPGDYYVSVAAIDDDAFESPPSARRKLSVVPVYLLTPGAAPVADEGDAADEEASAATRPTPVLRGTRLDIPGALRCRIDDQEPSREPTLDTVGEHTVSCLTADGQPVPGFTISVMDVKIAASAQSTAVVRGQTSSARFTVDADIPLPRRLWADAPEGVLVGSPVPDPDGDGWTVRVHADTTAAAQTELRIMADAGGEPVELGQIPLMIDAPPDPLRPAAEAGEPRPERHMIEAGLFGGVLFPSTRHDLFQETYDTQLDYQAFDPVAGSVGLRLGYYPIRWVGLELENSLGPTRTRRGGERATLLAIRGHVLAQMPWRITPTLHVGGGALGVNAPRVLGRDFDRTLHFGGGAKFFATRWLAVRLDIRDVLSEANRGGVAHSPELILGVGGVLGRRSATARRAKSR